MLDVRTLSLRNAQSEMNTRKIEDDDSPAPAHLETVIRMLLGPSLSSRDFRLDSQSVSKVTYSWDVASPQISTLKPAEFQDRMPFTPNGTSGEPVTSSALCHWPLCPDFRSPCPLRLLFGIVGFGRPRHQRHRIAVLRDS
jgi:hypothetical protein